MRKLLGAQRAGALGGLALVVCLAAMSAGRAETFTLKNGMVLEGYYGSIASFGDPLTATGAGEIKSKRIGLVDNQLTRTFFFFSQIAKIDESPALSYEKIKINQRVATVGQPIGGVGGGWAEPFDEWGRRTYWMGDRPIVQGITEITPTWTKVEAIQGSKNYIWTMRIATSSIPRQQLSRILYRALDAKNSDQRLRIVRLYLQMEKFQDARLELEQLVKDFPELAALGDTVKSLRQMFAQRLLKEIELRREAGQYQLAADMLEQFPAEGVAGETLLKVKEMLDDLARQKGQGEKVHRLLGEHLAALKDDKLRGELTPIVEEIRRELHFHTLSRMADYLRLADDASLEAEQKLSLAISGWLLGSGAGRENLSVTRSLVQVRDIVRRYLVATRKPDLDNILAELGSLEGATPQFIAAIIAHMKPPLPLTALEPPPADVGQPADLLGLPAEKPSAAADKPADDESQPAPKAPPTPPAGEPQAPAIPGLLEFNVKSPLAEDPQVKYWVLLPPEYDPYRRYPCVVTLNGAGTTPLQQLDWWAGEFEPQSAARYGQATRHGYIVIAPRWTAEHQRSYGYSAREHNAVLLSLRDACKRLSIDVDRVFLSGHSMGGDAAWDIGLAHPDLWAGVIPIVATADKYVKHSYRENGEYVPMYFVCGEKDGNKLALNAAEWDYYLTHYGYDVMIVQYQGRGHEHFHDEIQNLFTWMRLHKRNFFPREFTVYSLRPWDKFFWWVETDKPLENNTLLPVEWGARTARASKTQAKVLATNGVLVTPTTGKVTVWLSPELVNFDSSVSVSIRGRKQTNIQPSIQTLLEDVRTRGDRQHPFWAKVEN